MNNVDYKDMSDNQAVFCFRECLEEAMKIAIAKGWTDVEVPKTNFKGEKSFKDEKGFLILRRTRGKSLGDVIQAIYGHSGFYPEMAKKAQQIND